MMTRRPDRTSMWAAGVVTLGLLGGACDAGGPPTDEATVACDDGIRVAKDLPRDLVDLGVTRAVGEADIWFIAPDEPTWGGSVVRSGDGFYVKRPLWTSSAKPPSVTVVASGSGATGEATLSPTSEGLPGPLPMGVHFPSRGCWTVTATSEKGRAEIVVKV
ncbi:hypothetical protein AB0M95_37765 [Sphaerisporangium sp. NPDC051017]|uniref:hypothetical protein n=1 Tax=Sphaerisporangium sp. NPDC051017 TaxID=3154636 RepID=UPI00344AF9C7